MITPMQMYWLLKLDDIRTLCGSSIGIMAAVMAFSLLTYFNEEDGIKKKAVVVFVCSIFGLGLNISALTFLPSTKQMAAIYVVPTIANNEKVQNIGNKTLDISNQLLDITKEYLKDKAKNK